MTPRTLTEPVTSKSMWRKLLRRCHPDAGGSSDLFIWARALHEHVVGERVEDARTREERRRPPPHPSTGERIDFSATFDVADDFEDLTARIMALSEELEEPYRSVLSLVADCYPSFDGPLYRAQHQGATFKQLAYIGHLCGMDAAQRGRWYDIAQHASVSQRHAGHLVSKLKREAA